MIGSLEYARLQELWWILVSLVGSLFLFLAFVQGGQTLLPTLARDKEEKNLIVNSLGRKWELTFTTLVLFGGALFAAFPLFYATSFGGAYWMWIMILLTFVTQAVSYEFRRKSGNLLGTGTYDAFLFLNGSAGLFLIGVAVGTFFTGAPFRLNAFNQVFWQNPLRGLEAAANLFNASLGLFLVFHARALGALYLVNNVDHGPLEEKARKAVLTNFLLALPFLLLVLARLATMKGFAVDPQNGVVFLENHKYLKNLLAMPASLILLLAGLGLVLWGVLAVSFKEGRKGIWSAGTGTVLTALAFFSIAGFNNTAFYPSTFHPQSSLTIYTASSSKYTLAVMGYVALAVPFVVAYIGYCWHLMDKRKLSAEDLGGESANELY